MYFMNSYIICVDNIAEQQTKLKMSVSKFDLKKIKLMSLLYITDGPKYFLKILTHHKYD